MRAGGVEEDHVELAVDDRADGAAAPPQLVLVEMLILPLEAVRTEELTRLQSHFKQFDECTRSEDPVGRTLDFLAQEMNREVNTMGSKADGLRVSELIIAAKAELEKMREQVQNVE